MNSFCPVFSTFYVDLGWALYAIGHKVGSDNDIVRLDVSSDCWISIKPEFSHTSSPGLVKTIAVRGNNLYAGTNGFGVLQYQGKDSSWKQINEGLTSFNVASLIILNDAIYAGTITGVFWASLSE